jgi:hypothetical protein
MVDSLSSENRTLQQQLQAMRNDEKYLCAHTALPSARGSPSNAEVGAQVPAQAFVHEMCTGRSQDKNLDGTLRFANDATCTTSDLSLTDSFRGGCIHETHNNPHPTTTTHRKNNSNIDSIIINSKISLNTSNNSNNTSNNNNSNSHFSVDNIYTQDSATASSPTRDISAPNPSIISSKSSFAAASSSTVAAPSMKSNPGFSGWLTYWIDTFIEET